MSKKENAVRYSESIYKSARVVFVFLGIAFCSDTFSMQNERHELSGSDTLSSETLRELTKQGGLILKKVVRGNKLLIDYFDQTTNNLSAFLETHEFFEVLIVPNSQKEEETNLIKSLLLQLLLDDDELKNISRYMFGQKINIKPLLRTEWFLELNEEDQKDVLRAKELVSFSFWDLFQKGMKRYLRKFLGKSDQRKITEYAPSLKYSETYYPDRSVEQMKGEILVGKTSISEKETQEINKRASEFISNSSYSLQEAKRVFLALLMHLTDVQLTKRGHDTEFRLRASYTLGGKQVCSDHTFMVETLSPVEFNIGFFLRAAEDYPLCFFDVKKPRTLKPDFSLKPLVPSHRPVKKKGNEMLYNAILADFKEEIKESKELDSKDTEKYSVGLTEFSIRTSNLFDMLKLQGFLLDLTNSFRIPENKCQRGSLKSLISNIDTVLTSTFDSLVPGIDTASRSAITNFDVDALTLRFENCNLLNNLKKLCSASIKKEQTQATDEIISKEIHPEMICLNRDTLSEVWKNFIASFVRKKKMSELYDLENIMYQNSLLSTPSSVPTGFNVEVLRKFINPKDENPVVRAITEGFLGHSEKHFSLGLAAKVCFAPRCCIHTCLMGKSLSGRELEIIVLNKLLERSSFIFEREKNGGFSISLDDLMSKSDMEYILSDVKKIIVLFGDSGQSIKGKKNSEMFLIDDIKDSITEWRFYLHFQVLPFDQITVEQLKTGLVGTFYLEAPLDVKLKLRKYE